MKSAYFAASGRMSAVTQVSATCLDAGRAGCLRTDRGRPFKQALRGRCLKLVAITRPPRSTNISESSYGAHSSREGRSADAFRKPKVGWFLRARRQREPRIMLRASFLQPESSLLYRTFLDSVRDAGHILRRRAAVVSYYVPRPITGGEPARPWDPGGD